MTDKPKPLENPAEEPTLATSGAPAALPPTAQLTAQPVETVAPQKPGRGRAWWILSSAAGAALLVMGLLGGILIGQTMQPSGGQARTAQVFIERGQPGQMDQLPQRLKERLQQRQDHRQDRGNQEPPAPAPTAPSTGSGG